MKSRNWGKLAATSALGIFLSFSFAFLAALPIRYLRIGFGRSAFVGVTVLATIALLLTQQWQWALVYFSISFLVGSYSEMESQEFSIFLSSAVSIVLTSLLSLFCFGLIAKSQGQGLLSFFETKLTPFKEQLLQMPQLKEYSDLTSIVQFLPAALVITFMLLLFAALSIYSDTNLEKRSGNLKSFVLPDEFIWGLILALGGSLFFKSGTMASIVSINGLCVVFAAYFFQGMAVVTSFLDHFRIFGFWRLLIYFAIFLQFFLFVSFAGVLDVWMNFRQKIKLKNKTLESQ